MALLARAVRGSAERMRRETATLNSGFQAVVSTDVVLARVKGIAIFSHCSFSSSGSHSFVSVAIFDG